MKAPLIRTTPGQVQLKVGFSDMIAGKMYRIGVGTAQGKLATVELKLMQDDQVLEKESVHFVQKNTSSWWQVNSISTHGYVLSNADLPDPSGELTLEVNLSKEEADQLTKLFLFIARKYGPNRWYPEDGMELGASDF